MSDIKVSVIVPVYNVAKYLPKCIDSILNQTLKDIEIILVSDGPEQDTNICKEYASKYNNIKLIENVNRGLGGARNVGIEKAKAEYIAFIDSDDWIEPTFLEKMYNAMISDKEIDIVQCGTNIVWEGKINEKQNEGDVKYFAINQTGAFKLTNDYFGNINVGTWNKLYKKSLINKYNLRFPEKMCNEDAYFTWAYWSVCNKIYFIPEKLYNYLRRDTSLMAQTFKKGMGEKVLHHLIIAELLYDFLQNNNLFKDKESAYWMCLLVSWWFVNSNGDEANKKIGFNKLHVFLRDKKVPDNFSELIHIQTHGCLERWKYLFGIKCVKVIEIFQMKKYKLFGKWTIIKEKRQPNKRELLIFGVPVYKKQRTWDKIEYSLFNKKVKTKGFHKIYNIKGENNKIIIVEEDGSERPISYEESIPGLNIHVNGENNIVKLYKPFNFINANIVLPDNNNCNIIIKPSLCFRWTVNFWGGANNSSFFIDEHAEITAPGILHFVESNAHVKIGKNFLCAGKFNLWTQDGHSVLDMDGNILNLQNEYNITIGDNVWIGNEVSIVKNVKIPNNTIVALRSVVTKQFTEENTLIAGNPAHVVKRGLKWSSSRCENYKK